jgi:uncharacterized protein YeaO (DUF488 family)
MEQPSLVTGETPTLPAGAAADKGQPARGVIKTKRWNDPREPDDGFRLLICRYRPRALLKKDETWTLWHANLGPSRELHAAFYGKTGPPIGWDEYRTRYLAEMKEQAEEIAFLADLVDEGKTLTLLCSSACEDASHCHRTLLKGLIEEALRRRG